MKRNDLLLALLAALFLAAAVLIPEGPTAPSVTGYDPSAAFIRTYDWALMQDDKALYFGRDGDWLARYDASNAWLEFVPSATGSGVVIETSATQVVSVVGPFIVNKDAGSSWTVNTDGSITPTTGTTRYTTASLPLYVGDKISRVGVWYTGTALGASDMRITAVKTVGATKTHLATASSGTCFGATLWTSHFDYTAVANGSLRVALAGLDDGVKAYHLIVQYDKMRRGN